MENSNRFFNNHACKYFPCHAQPDAESFNCLFCYCPLYFLGDKCGGLFTFSGAKQVKNCLDCHLPHVPVFYDTVVSVLTDVADGKGP